MSKRLYIGNLPFVCNDVALMDIFSQAGAVTSAKVVTDRLTGRSKGFGFVEMATDEEAQAAIQKFDGADYEGRGMSVALAKSEGPGKAEAAAAGEASAETAPDQATTNTEQQG